MDTVDNNLHALNTCLVDQLVFWVCDFSDGTCSQGDSLEGE